MFPQGPSGAQGLGNYVSEVGMSLVRIAMTVADYTGRVLGRPTPVSVQVGTDIC